MSEAMSDETQGLASPPAEGGSEPVNLDAGTQQGQTEQQQEGAEGQQQAGEAGEKPEGETTERKRLSGAEKAKRRQTYLLNQLAEKDRELEELRQASRGNNGQQPDADKEPQEADFNGDFFAYQKAASSWSARQAVREEFRRQETTTRSQSEQHQLRERVIEFEERADDLRDTVPDFDKVVGSINTTIREELAREVLFSEKGPLLQYHLAQNPNELHRLNALSGRELAREIGRLEAKLNLPEAKKQTTAPAPLKPLKGGAAPAFDPLKTDDMDAFAKWLNTDLQKRSGRGR